MNILHIASFIGNIGDNASHKGLYTLFDGFFSSYTVTKVEIRRFYKEYRRSDKRKFDEGFIRFMNSFDLVVIGGGGFLDYWVPGSASGTTLDIEPDLLRKVHVPTFIISVGSFPHKEIPSGNKDKYRKFLDSALSNSNIFIAVRNDGSKESIKKDIGEEYAEKIPEVLDSGFFYDSGISSLFSSYGKYVALNITFDQINMLSHNRGSIEKSIYYSEFNNIIRYVVEVLGMNVVLVPHIYKDLKAITFLLDQMDDTLVRRSVLVAPHIQGIEGADILLSLYRDSEAVIATRLHANICSMAMGKKTVGIGALDRVPFLHRSLGSESYIDPSEKFSDEVIRLLKKDHDYSVMRVINKKKEETRHTYWRKVNSI